MPWLRTGALLAVGQGMPTYALWAALWAEAQGPGQELLQRKLFWLLLGLPT